MIVLDYPKEYVSSSIIVPPFHTGHLGFLPDTEVQVCLMAPHSRGATNCEVLITPYQPNTGNMTELSCRMEDEPGVVGGIVDAVSDLGINIVSLESSAINHLNHHCLHMLLDWSTSKYPRAFASSPNVQQHYQHYHSLFPVSTQRYVELFERIIQNCGKQLTLEDVSGIRLPSLRLRPMNPPEYLQSYGPVTVKRHPPGKPYHAVIELPQSLFGALRSKLRAKNDLLNYILVSETETRMLRVFFPKPGLIPCIVHLGFYHDDIPGALSPILATLKNGQFNILTSLLRQSNDRRNVLETVLEYRAQDSVPIDPTHLATRETGEQLCRWMADKILQNMSPSDATRLHDCDLQIGLPMYPKRANQWDGRIALSPLMEGGEVILSRGNSNHEIAVNDNAAIISSDDPDKLHLISCVRSRCQQTLPSIFLSYPHGARDHAMLIKRCLGTRYRLIEYQEPDAEVIRDQVVQKIHACDYFIGIWHHEQSGSISPWLPFEYGIALSARKKAIIVHSEKLHKSIWLRISPGIAQPEYSDVRFESEMVPLIDHYCREHFVSHPQLQLLKVNSV